MRGRSIPFIPFAGLRLAGTVIWVATFMLPGYYFADQAAAFLSQVFHNVL